MPKKKIDKEKAKTDFAEVAGKVKEIQHPTPKPGSLDHVGIKDDKDKPKQRHRRTQAEIQIEKNKMAMEPNPLFIPVLKMPFDAAAKAHKDERIRLTEDEARKWALPITQLMEHYCPNMPHIWFAWGNLLLTSYAIIELRMKIIGEKKKANVSSDKSGGKKGTSGSGQEGRGQEFPNQTELEHV